MMTRSRTAEVVFFVGGPTLLVFGLFSFGHVEIAGDNSVAVAYSYGTSSLLSLAIGTALIAIGTLRKTWESVK
jgi:hypothetical protein